MLPGEAELVPEWTGLPEIRYNSFLLAWRTSSNRLSPQLFVQHHDAARRVEEEHDRELDRRNTDHSKTPGGSTTADGVADGGGTEEAEQSGVWQESESGLEWVVIPVEDKGDNEGKDDEGDDSELRIQTSSQDDDENVTKGSGISLSKYRFWKTSCIDTVLWIRMLVFRVEIYAVEQSSTLGFYLTSQPG